MKKFFALALCAALLAGCTSETRYGKCIGAFDDANPGLHYRTSGWNIFMGFVFSEFFLIPPVIVFAHEIRCPDGYKNHEQYIENNK